MPKNSITDIIGGIFRVEKEAVFVRFRDSLGNFEIFYPEGWRYDEDIVVVDGKYTISYQSRDRSSQLTVSVDSQLGPGFEFGRYAKDELESPSSGVYTQVVKSRFKDMDAYRREYLYTSGGKSYFGGGVMFYTGDLVFSISWSAPTSGKQKLSRIFDHMLETIVIRQSPKSGRRKKITPGTYVDLIKETEEK